MRRRELEIKAVDFVLLEKHRLCSSRQKRAAKFVPKLVGSFEDVEVKRIIY